MREPWETADSSTKQAGRDQVEPNFPAATGLSVDPALPTLVGDFPYYGRSIGFLRLVNDNAGSVFWKVRGAVGVGGVGASIAHGYNEEVVEPAGGGYNTLAAGLMESWTLLDGGYDRVRVYAYGAGAGYGLRYSFEARDEG
jgi:hypothetical protein